MYRTRTARQQFHSEMKIHGDFTLFAAAHFEASKFIPSPVAGIDRFSLDRVGGEKARATTIVQYHPNSKFPEHEHIGGEEFLVLEGTFKDEFGVFPAGTYVRNPIGSKHAPWVDNDGCTIMVKLLQMAETGDGTAPLHICLDDKKSSGRKAEFGRVLDLYQNSKTGEHVQMCWLDAHQAVPAPDCTNGEEIFVVEGALLFGTESFEKWGWMRFPAGTRIDKRTLLRAGSTGAQIFRKTGHLSEEALALEKVQFIDDENVAGNRGN
jgi:ChrR Cupin-like domain